MSRSEFPISIDGFWMGQSKSAGTFEKLDEATGELKEIPYAPRYVIGYETAEGNWQQIELREAALRDIGLEEDPAEVSRMRPCRLIGGLEVSDAGKVKDRPASFVYFRVAELVFG